MSTRTGEKQASGEFAQLPAHFSRSGFVMRQVQRSDRAAIYAQGKDGRESYEVIRIGRAKAVEVFGKPIPARETYPSSEQWGTRGWTYADLPAAERRYAELLNRETPQPHP